MVSRYRTYKGLTNKIAAGLLGRAEACGHVVKDNEKIEIPSNNPPASSTRLKGKARKLAKEAAAAGSRAGNDQVNVVPEKPRIVKTANFVKLAKVVASAAIPVQIPSALISGLRETIQLLKAFSKNYHQLYESDSHEDDGHRDFIDILEEVLNILSAACDATKRTSSTKIPRASNATTGETRNLFATLTEFESDTEDFEEEIDSEAPKIHAVTIPVPPVVIVEHNDGQKDSEVWYALFCMADDLHDIRQYIKTLWSDYAEDPISLATASAITNTAIALSKVIVDDVLSQYPLFKSYAECQTMLAIGYGGQETLASLTEGRLLLLSTDSRFLIPEYDIRFEFSF